MSKTKSAAEDEESSAKEEVRIDSGEDAVLSRMKLSYVVDVWFGAHYPESNGEVAYLSGEWHRAHEAKEDLKRRIADAV